MQIFSLLRFNTILLRIKTTLYMKSYCEEYINANEIIEV